MRTAPGTETFSAHVPANVGDGDVEVLHAATSKSKRRRSPRRMITSVARLTTRELEPGNMTEVA